MKKSTYLVIMLALLLGLSALPAVAQTTGVKGVCKDQEGKFIADAVVELTNTDTGRKVSGKTDKNGEYRVIGLTQGDYDAVLIRNGVKVDSFSRIPVAVGDTRDVNFDLKKDLAGVKGPSEEEIKKQQEVVKQNEKIKGLNAKLTQSRELEKAGNYDQAIAILQEAATADPTKDLVWAYLGDANVGAKKYPDAVTAFEKAVALKPDSALYHNALANAYNRAGQPDKALAEYNQVVQMDPTNAATAYFNIGIVNYNTNKPDEAVTAFDKSIQLDPARADAYYYKGMALLTKATIAKDGKYSPAPGTVEAFQKYIELKPDGTNVQTAKDTIAMLGGTVETTYGTKKAAPTKKKPN